MSYSINERPCLIVSRSAAPEGRLAGHSWPRNKRRGRLVNTPTSYSEGFRFKPQHDDRRIFSFYAVPSGKLLVSASN